jgi:hypothetical protein
MNLAPPFREWLMPDGSVWANFYRLADGYQVQFPDLATFDISYDDFQVKAHPAEGVDEATVNHLYLNQIYPLVLSGQGQLVFHGGAVEVPGGAVAFLGNSGRGKSTLTASFACEGHKFMTDDCLLLSKEETGYSICPSHPSIRLWDDSRQALVHGSATLGPAVQYTPKARVLSDDALSYCDSKRPLRRVYFLGQGDATDVAIEAMAASEALIELAKNSFLLDTEIQDVMAKHFDELFQMVAQPIYFRLDYPRDYAYLPQVRAAILAHAASAGQ